MGWRNFFFTRGTPPRSYPTTFGVKSDVGPGYRNDPDDVVAAKYALAWAGCYPKERHLIDDPTADRGLFDATGQFQLARDLEPDNRIFPDCETHRLLDERFSAKISEATAHGDFLEGTGFDRRKLDGTQVAALPFVVPALAAGSRIAVPHASRGSRKKTIIVENRKGNAETQKELDRIRDAILDANPEFVHVAGGRRRYSGDEMEEFHIPGLAKTFGGDGRRRRPGS
jgi:hypothetical protein